MPKNFPAQHEFGNHPYSRPQSVLSFDRKRLRMTLATILAVCFIVGALPAASHTNRVAASSDANRLESLPDLKTSAELVRGQVIGSQLKASPAETRLQMQGGSRPKFHRHAGHPNLHARMVRLMSRPATNTVSPAMRITPNPFGGPRLLNLPPVSNPTGGNGSSIGVNFNNRVLNPRVVFPTIGNRPVFSLSSSNASDDHTPKASGTSLTAVPPKVFSFSSLPDAQSKNAGVLHPTVINQAHNDEGFTPRKTATAVDGNIGFAPAQILPKMQSASEPAPTSHQTNQTGETDAKITIQAEQLGSPLIHLQNGRELAAAAQESNSTPSVMASADFDSDGVADLVTADSSGALRFYRGNADSIHPNSPQAKQHKADKTFVDAPFYASEKSFSLKTTPDFLEVGDFNADGKKDVLALAKGDNRLYVLLGDGHGNFSEPTVILLAGKATVLAVGEIGQADGQTDIAVAVQTDKGTKLLVFEHPEGACKYAPEVFSLPGAVTDLVIGNLDGDFYGDIAVASGNLLTIVHGRGQAYPWDMIKSQNIKRPPAIVASRAMPFSIAGLAIGKFSNEPGRSLAILAADSSIHLLEPVKTTTTNTALLAEAKAKGVAPKFAPNDVETTGLAVMPQTLPDSETAKSLMEAVAQVKPGAHGINVPVDPALAKVNKAQRAELMAAKAAEGEAMSQRAKDAFLQTISAKPSTLPQWNLQRIADSGLRVVDSSAAKKMVTARVSLSGKDDLVLVDANSNQLHIVIDASHGGAQAMHEVVSLDVTGSPLAVLPMRLNDDALSDLVVLRNGASQPSFVITAPTQTLTVNITDDIGTSCNFIFDTLPCSLRSAILAANFTPGTLIKFKIPGGGVHTISPVAELPVVTAHGTVIDGTTQPGYAGGGLPVIEIKGDHFPRGTSKDGLKIRASNCKVSGLAINEYPSFTDPNTGSKIGGNGLTLESTRLFPNNGNNEVSGNYLGTDPTGTVAKGNEATGLNVFDSHDNYIVLNLMSANLGAGLALTNGNNNIIQANVIGTTKDGHAKLGNGQGVFLTGSNNQFGGDSGFAINQVSGNGVARPPTATVPGCDGPGLYIPALVNLDTGELLTFLNLIKSNYIGTDGIGTPLGNCSQGILTLPLVATVIGSISEFGRNTISDNGLDGIWCTEFNLTQGANHGGFCSIAGNNIGTNADGTIAMGNTAKNSYTNFTIATGQVTLFNNFTYSNIGALGGTTPGGRCSGFCNLISGRTAGYSGADDQAVLITGNGTMGVFNNYIGTNIDGNQAISNALGVTAAGNPIDWGTFLIGGIGLDSNNVEFSLGNLISGNHQDGFQGLGLKIGGNGRFTVQGNLIGTDATGVNAIPNGSSTNVGDAQGGIWVAGGYKLLTIGDTNPLGRNIISGNNGGGLNIAYGFGANVITIVNNYIGVNRPHLPLGNAGTGINFTLTYDGATIGGASPEEANVIVSNGSAGILLLGDSSVAPYGVNIQGNSIHDNGGLGIDLSPGIISDGVTANDCLDPDDGPNGLQNYPVLAAPVDNGNGTKTVTGYLSSQPSTPYRLDFYINGFGGNQGGAYIGSINVTTQADGIATFSFITAEGLPITATATSPDGSTSEFSCIAGTCYADPEVCTAIIVTTTGDEPDEDQNDGLCDIDRSTPVLECTLRAAIQEANARVAAGQPRQFITFNITGGGPHTIAPFSPLPDIAKNITINGTTQPGAGFGGPTIELSGANLGTGANGLRVSGGGVNIRGLAVNRFVSGNGIVLDGAQGGSHVFECFIGFDPSLQPPPGDMTNGILIDNSPGNLIGSGGFADNYFAGSRSHITIQGSASRNNTVTQNVFDQNYADSFPNPQGRGVTITNGAQNNLIGSPSKTTNFFTSELYGVLLSDGATNNKVLNNYIHGCYIGVGITRASGNQIGGLSFDPLIGNTISNTQIGIYLSDTDPPAPNAPGKLSAQLLSKTKASAPRSQQKPGSAPRRVRALGPNTVLSSTSGNTIQHNTIGAPPTGTPVSQYGIFIGDADNNLIGGQPQANGNFIRFNSQAGIFLDSGAANNTIQHNNVGLDFNDAPGQGNGVGVAIAGPDNTVTQNVISGNTQDGVQITGSNAVVTANFIGTNNAGTAPASNVRNGIFVGDGAQSPIITGNTISGNLAVGVEIGAGGSGVSIANNRIGTDQFGIFAIGNLTGIAVHGSGNTIAGNTVSGNTLGIYIAKLSSNSPLVNGNIIQGNRIGTNFTGTAALPNTQFGVLLANGADHNVIGAIAYGNGDPVELVNGINPLGNLISGNGQSGIVLEAGNTTGAIPPLLNKIQGNLIGTDKTGTIAIPNGQAGIFIHGSTGNLIGGFDAEIPLARNIISANVLSGVDIGDPSSAQNRVSGNYLGTKLDGVGMLGNSYAGVSLHAGAHDNIVGGTEQNAGNIIAFNVQAGVTLFADAGSGNLIDPNSIHDNGGLGIDLGNTRTPLPNDPGDADSGPNNLQNYPEITSAQISPSGDLIVQYKVDSAPANSNYGTSGFHIEFFKADATGQGQVFLGEGSYTLADYNNGTPGTKEVNLGNAAGLGVGAGDALVATTTDADGNTSEFAPASGLTPPTAVKLVGFSAVARDSSVLLNWKTGFEVDNLGFNVYREVDGVRTRITPQVVAGSALSDGPGTSLLSGHNYYWADTPPVGKTVRYFLEDIDLNGKSTFNGPYAITSAPPGSAADAQKQSELISQIGMRQALLAGGLGSAPLTRAATLATPTAAALQTQSGLASQPAVKIAVKREGYYRVTQAELLRAALDLKVDPRMLQLFVDGIEVPIKVNGDQDGRFDATDSLEFYGVGVDNASTDTRVYWLVAGTKPGKRIAVTQGKGDPLASSGFPFTVERKDRTIYFAGLRNGDAENFFGAVVASQPVDQSLSIQHLDQASQTGASLEVALQGVTKVAHSVRVQLNGTDVTRLSFTGQSQGRKLVSISQSLLREGDNTVRLLAEGGASDVSLVDVIRISYSHSCVADGDGLKLVAESNRQVSISGFTRRDIRLMDVTDAASAQEIVATVTEGKNSTTVTGAAAGLGSRALLAFSDSQAQHPWAIKPNQPSNLRQSANGADLLIITQREYFSTVTGLKTLRESQGLSVAVVDIEDIYDEFSFGNSSSQAVKDFATYATANWKKKPRYLLLAGDASYDPKNYLGLGLSDLVPTKLLDTVYMETASDDWFADFNNDGVPELAVGRLPFSNAAQASTMIAKIVGYDRSSRSEEALLVSDANDGFDFETASAQLAGTLPTSLKINQINRGADTAGARTRLMEAINRGQKLVNYVGHGSVNQWRGNLLVNEDASQMNNTDHLSVFVMMACLNGYFDDPALDSLAESLLKAERGGAVAVWSSSGMTLPADQTRMNQALYKSMFGPEGIALLGDAIREAKTKSSDVDIRRTWVLLGDPTMRLR